VLITGESGTGKELVARALHDHSPRSKKTFVALNTSAIASELLESELFGHEKGAFTGADARRIGRFEQADGGTLFLDEIGDMSPALQTRLLRVLAESEFYRVGGQQLVKVDVRVVAATNQNLARAVKESRFREDLYHRLNVIRIHSPPLRQRRVDIPVLLNHYLSTAARELEAAPKSIDADALVMLQNYDWPGNVRQLENIIERAVALSRGTSIALSALPETLLRKPEISYSCQIPAEGVNLEDLIDNYERALLNEAMRIANGVKKRAAQLLRISFRSFRYRYEKLGLDQSDRGRS